MTGDRVLPPLRRWTEGGGTVRIGGHSVFVRQDGLAHGAPVTLVHGFPTSSHDWAAVVPALVAAGLRVTTLDLLGFGESDKPRRHRYSVLDQASLVEEVWRRYGIGSTALVAHDYGVSVGQELLARDPARIARMAWLNGGLYPDLHRPVPIQRLLHGPLGPLLAPSPRSGGSPRPCAGCWDGRSTTRTCATCGRRRPAPAATASPRDCCGTSTSAVGTPRAGPRPWRAFPGPRCSCGGLPTRSAARTYSPGSGRACRGPTSWSSPGLRPSDITRNWRIRRRSQQRSPGSWRPEANPLGLGAQARVTGGRGPALDVSGAGRGRRSGVRC